MKPTEGGTSTFIHAHTQFYRDNTEFEFFMHKKLEETPLDITFSPLGKCFFVSFKVKDFLGVHPYEFKVSQRCLFDTAKTHFFNSIN